MNEHPETSVRRLVWICGLVYSGNSGTDQHKIDNISQQQRVLEMWYN